MSSPITTASSSIFTTATRKLFYNDEFANVYQSITNAAPQNMVVGKGYIRKFVEGEPNVNTTYNFTGTLNNGTVTRSGLTLTDANPLPSKGWHLLGNPYPSSLDWQAASGWTFTNINNEVHFKTNGQDKAWVSGASVNGGTQYIPPMQAFWVKVNNTAGGEVVMNNAARVHNTQNIYKTTNSDNNLMKLKVTNLTNNLSDEIIVNFNANATENYDNKYDAQKMFADEVYNYSELYTKIGEHFMAINSLPALSGEKIVPIGFKTLNQGNYTINFQDVINITSNGNSVYFVDNETGATINLANNNNYTFASTATDNITRFKLHFNPNNSVKEETGTDVVIYSYDNSVIVKGIDKLEGSVAIYDLLGNLLIEQKVSGEDKATISLNNNSAAVYLVKYTSNNKVITKRVNIQ